MISNSLSRSVWFRRLQVELQLDLLALGICVAALTATPSLRQISPVDANVTDAAAGRKTPAARVPEVHSSSTKECPACN
jgi:hypothetical protein